MVVDELDSRAVADRARARRSLTPPTRSRWPAGGLSSFTSWRSFFSSSAPAVVTPGVRPVSMPDCLHHVRSVSGTIPTREPIRCTAASNDSSGLLVAALHTRAGSPDPATPAGTSSVLASLHLSVDQSRHQPRSASDLKAAQDPRLRSYATI